MGQKLTRTGARRSGDDYQDLVAAKALIGLLKHPSRYRWVKLEAREAGRLDDVIVLRVDGTVEAMQVRYSTDVLRPGDPWTWRKLLDNPKGRNSLIQVWHESVIHLDSLYSAVEPRLVSNRRAGNDFVITPDGHLDKTRTPQEILVKIRSQLRDYTDDFLERFRFEVDEQDLGDLDESLMREFQALGLSEANWLSFKDAIRSWIRGERLPPSGEISIEEIRSASGWRRLIPLPQNLEIPKDYTLPHPEFHNRFLERVKKGSGSAIVLTAGPGVGKSTYLSYLVQVLRQMDQPVIRHHYSLRASSDRLERLDSRRVSESLMAEIEAELGPHLGELFIRNRDPGALSEWLIEVGRQLVEQGKHLVVVVDGLDHVWRERASREELSRLFDQLLPVPPGIVIIVGTQPVEDRQLPLKLIQLQPRNCWVELPRLDRQAIIEWLTHYRDLMPPEWNQDSLNWNRSELATLLRSRTGGHPLLIRYIVERIAVGGKRLTVDSVRAIPKTPTDSVEDYYRVLWVSLPEEARDIVFILAIADFPWPEGGLFECLRLAGYERASSAAGVAAVRHLLGSDKLGLWPFHDSILLFAKQQQEFSERAPALRSATIDWLKTKAPDYWRRSHLWLLQMEAGDPGPLLAGSDRRWAVEAVAAGHPLDEVERVIQAAAWEAIEQGDFPTYAERGVIADAVREGANADETLVWLFAAQLMLGTDDFLEPRAIAGMRELSDSHVLALALHVHEKGKHVEAADCFEEISRRINREGGDGDDRWAENGRQRFETVTELAGLIGVDAKRIMDFAAQFSAEDTKASVAESWATGLRRTQDVRSALQALGEPISSVIQRCLSRHVALMTIDEGIHLSQNERQLLASPYAWVYRAFGEDKLDTETPEEPQSPELATDYAYGEYGRTVGRYIHDLFFFLVIRDLQSPGFVSHWEPPKNLRPWLVSSLKAIAQGASAIASAWRDEGDISVTAAYDATLSLKNPPWDGGTVDRECAAGLRRSLRTITEDLLVLQRATGEDGNLRWAEVEAIASHRFAGFESILRWLADRSVGMERDAIDDLCNSLEDELASTIGPFVDRATTFALLATVCARYGFLPKARHYLSRSSENLIAYGYHKDLLLHTTLNTIAVVAGHCELRQRLWIGLAPAIASVEEFTDGDETSHLAGQLGKLLLRFDPNLGTAYMQWLMDAEKYSDVNDVMRELASIGDLTDPVVRALVSTFVDPQSIRVLEERAAGSNLIAQEILAFAPMFSADFAERDTHPLESVAVASNSAGKGFGSGGTDRYLEFPPEQIDQLVRSLELAWPIARGDELFAWLCRWAETERAADALEAVEPYFLEDDFLRVSNQAVEAVRKIAGRTRSYTWLVLAHRSNNGWFEYWSPFKEAKERWELVRRDFPDNWHRFLVETIKPLRGFTPHFGLTIARLVEYLAYFEQWNHANATTSRLVDTVAELVSGQELPIPPWTKPK